MWDLLEAATDGTVVRPDLPAAVCPHCGTSSGYDPAIKLGSSFNLGVFFLGGIPALIFRNAGRPRRVQCRRCGALFTIKTRASKVFRVLFWLVIAPGILALIVLAVGLLLGLLGP